MCFLTVSSKSRVIGWIWPCNKDVPRCSNAKIWHVRVIPCSLAGLHFTNLFSRIDLLYVCIVHCIKNLAKLYSVIFWRIFTSLDWGPYLIKIHQTHPKLRLLKFPSDFCRSPFLIVWRFGCFAPPSCRQEIRAFWSGMTCLKLTKVD